MAHQPGRGGVPVRGFRARGRAKTFGAASALSELSIAPPMETGEPQCPATDSPGQSAPTRGENTPSGEATEGTGSVPGGLKSISEEERYKKFLLARDYLTTRPPTLVDKKGESGTTVQLAGNYFHVQLKNQADWRLYQHHVEISPELDVLRVRRAIIWKLQDQLPAYIFDGGAMLFAASKVNPDPLKLTCEIVDKGVTEAYEVTIKFTNDLMWNHAGVIQFYNVLVRKSLQALKLTQIGRYYFDGNKKIDLPEFGLEIWPGIKTSMLPYESMVLLNMEMTNKIIRKDSVLSVMNEIREHCRDQTRVTSMIEVEVEGATVITLYNNRTYKIDSIDWNSKVTDTFETKNGPVTFVDYYATRSERRITDMSQPLLRAKTSKINPREILLVPELCHLTGLTQVMKNNFQLTASLKKHLFAEPAKRVSQLRGFMARLRGHNELTTEMQRWDIRYRKDDSLIQVPARQLPGEKIVFGREKQFSDPSNTADWTKGFRGETLFSTVPLATWVVVATNRDQGGLDTFIKTMQRVAQPLNYKIQNPTRKIASGSLPNEFKRAIEDVYAQLQGKINLIMLILPNNSTQLYSTVKQKCAVEFGIPSQCVLAKNCLKANMSVCTKIVVQMCAKQGGEPWTVLNPLAKSGTMVVGFDVYHAGQQGQGKQSVGAMVATFNQTLSRYTSQVQMCQMVEVNKQVGKTLAILVNKYHEVNNELPKRILFYRDGVGEGQLGEVAKKEIAAIEEEVGKLYKKNGLPFPKLTFVVVSKRINARFMKEGGTDAQGFKDFRNPLPGTVVDDVVTLPERYDFYLISQQARQGTVSPTSYNVIRDDGSLPPDRLQIFTFKLCHLYYNWSGTVAVPAVCQYAHKLAFLTGMSLNKPAHSNLANLLHFL